MLALFGADPSPSITRRGQSTCHDNGPTRHPLANRDDPHRHVPRSRPGQHPAPLGRRLAVGAHDELTDPAAAQHAGQAFDVVGVEVGEHHHRRPCEHAAGAGIGRSTAGRGRRPRLPRPQHRPRARARHLGRRRRPPTASPGAASRARTPATARPTTTSTTQAKANGGRRDTRRTTAVTATVSTARATADSTDVDHPIAANGAAAPRSRDGDDPPRGQRGGVGDQRRETTAHDRHDGRQHTEDGGRRHSGRRQQVGQDRHETDLPRDHRDHRSAHGLRGERHGNGRREPGRQAARAAALPPTPAPARRVRPSPASRARNRRTGRAMGRGATAGVRRRRAQRDWCAGVR